MMEKESRSRRGTATYLSMALSYNISLDRSPSSYSQRFIRPLPIYLPNSNPHQILLHAHQRKPPFFLRLANGAHAYAYIYSNTCTDGLKYTQTLVQTHITKHSYRLTQLHTTPSTNEHPNRVPTQPLHT
jgi:hypothetical protein